MTFRQPAVFKFHFSGIILLISCTLSSSTSWFYIKQITLCLVLSLSIVTAAVEGIVAKNVRGATINQPRPQGFSLKKWVGKALGTRLTINGTLACEPQTYFRSSLLSLRKERRNDRKYVCGSQATIKEPSLCKVPSPFVQAKSEAFIDSGKCYSF